MFIGVLDIAFLEFERMIFELTVVFDIINSLYYTEKADLCSIWQ